MLAVDAVTWVSAVGSLLAVVAALGLFQWQRSLDHRRAVDEDLDNTRLLLYTAQSLTMRHGMIDGDRAATIMNALVHHSCLVREDDANSLTFVLTTTSGEPHVNVALISGLIHKVSERINLGPKRTSPFDAAMFNEIAVKRGIGQFFRS